MVQPSTGQGWLNWERDVRVVKIPCVPEKALMVGVFVSPRPGVPLRETWEWKPLLHTPSSGVWVLPGALQSLGFFGIVGCGCLLG